MKRRIGLLVLLTILLGGILAGCNNKEVYRLIKVNSFEGETSMNRAEEVIEMFEGIQLISNDKVTTGSDGLVELLVDTDKTIAASSDTCFSVETVGDETQGKVTINLEYGTTLIEIQNKLTDGSEFEVVTPNATLSVRGTIFEVNYDVATNETTLTVMDGVVEATTNIESREINAGETVVIQDVNIIDVNAEDIGIDDTEEEYVPDHTTDPISHTEEIVQTISSKDNEISLSFKQLEGEGEVVIDENWQGDDFLRVTRKVDGLIIYCNLYNREWPSLEEVQELEEYLTNSYRENYNGSFPEGSGVYETTNSDGEEIIVYNLLTPGMEGVLVDKIFYKKIDESHYITLTLEKENLLYVTDQETISTTLSQFEEYVDLTKDCYYVIE